MSHYPDLSPCDYFGDPDLPPLVAVGWLEAPFDYPRGRVERTVYERLRELSRAQWQPYLYAGYQPCDLCQFDGHRCSTNLFVPGSGVTYACPEAIVHYIACHGYQPPDEFCAAVLRMPPPDSPQYFAALRANGWPPSIAQPYHDAQVRRLLTETSIAEPRGKALVAAITAYGCANGALPATFEHARRLVDEVGEWTYEVSGDTYLLYAWSDGENDSGRLLFHHAGYCTLDPNPVPFGLESKP